MTPQLEPGVTGVSGRTPRWPWVLLALFLGSGLLVSQCIQQSINCWDGCGSTPPPPRLEQSFAASVTLSADRPAAIRDVTATLARPLGSDAIHAELLLEVAGGRVRVAAGDSDGPALPVVVRHWSEVDPYIVGSVPDGGTTLHRRIIVELAEPSAAPVTLSLTLVTRLTAAYGTPSPSTAMALDGGHWQTVAPAHVTRGAQEGDLDLTPGRVVEGTLSVRLDPAQAADPADLVVDRTLAFTDETHLPNAIDVTIDPAVTVDDYERGFATIGWEPRPADFRDVLACPVAAPCVLTYTVRIDAGWLKTAARAHWRFEADLADYSGARPPARRSVMVTTTWKTLAPERAAPGPS